MTKPWIIGHRGDPYNKVENTLASFQSAFRHGAVGVETDVQVTRDGVPILFHDKTLAGIGFQPPGGDGRLPVRELCYEEIRRASFNMERYQCRLDATDCLSHNPADVFIPMLSEIMPMLPAQGRLFLELKTDPADQEYTARLVDAVSGWMSEYADPERVVPISFDAEALVMLQARQPHFDYGLNVSDTTSHDADNLKQLRNRLQLRYWLPPFSTVTPASVERCQRLSMGIIPWVDRFDQAYEIEQRHRLAFVPVAGVITNQPSVLLQILG